MTEPRPRAQPRLPRPLARQRPLRPEAAARPGEVLVLDVYDDECVGHARSLNRTWSRGGVEDSTPGCGEAAAAPYLRWYARHVSAQRVGSSWGSRSSL